jgi:hypothetical protein
MLGRHSPIELLPQPQILLLFFTLAVLGLNSGHYACKAALYCLSHIIISNLSWKWARTHCFSNEIRVWSSRSKISFHVSWKVWITEIRAWLYLSGHQYSCLDVFKFSLDLITGRGHTTCSLPTIACWRGKHLLRCSEYWSGLEGTKLYRGPQFTFFTFIEKV